MRPGIKRKTVKPECAVLIYHFIVKFKIARLGNAENGILFAGNAR